MNMPEHIDRLTFDCSGNESENQVNSLLFFSSPRGALLFLGRRSRRRRREQRNAAKVSATPLSLLKKQEGGEKDLGKGTGQDFGGGGENQ